MIRRRRTPSKTNWALIGGIVLAVGALAYIYFTRIADKFIIGDITYRVGSWEFTHININLLIPVRNESNLKATFNNFMGDLLYQGRSIASLDVSQTIDIQPQATFSIPVVARIETTRVIGSIIDTIRTGRLDRNFTVRGIAVIQGYRVPINYTFDPIQTMSA